MQDNKLLQTYHATPTLLHRSFLFISLCCLIAYRQPVNLIEPRFWAEEGKDFFSFAFSHGWFETVFNVFPHLGYYSLAHNLAALSATFIPLEQAPFVTTYLGFISHLLPCLIVVFGNSPFWNTLSKKILICLGVLFFPFGRMWLNTTYIHFTLALNIFLILLEEMEYKNRLTKNFFRAIIIIGGFSGTVSCFLTPVFLLKAWRSKLKEDIIQSSLLVIALFVQVSILIYSLSTVDQSSQSRFVSFGYEQLWSIIKFQFGIPFYGHPYFNSNFIKALDFRSFYLAFPYAYPLIGKASSIFQTSASLLSVLLVIAYTCFVFIKQIRDKYLQLPAISFLLMFALSSAGSLGMSGGWRYVYVPCVIILVMFIAEFYNKNCGLLRKSTAAFFIFSMLVVNGYSYRNSIEAYPVKWSDEVQTWQKDHNYKIKIWPYNDKSKCEMTLTP